jgi:hypothetical protein
MEEGSPEEPVDDSPEAILLLGAAEENILDGEENILDRSKRPLPTFPSFAAVVDRPCRRLSIGEGRDAPSEGASASFLV